MPRPLRPLVPGGIYHVTSRGNRQQEIFVDDTDRERFLALLADVVKRRRWLCHAYCLMNNHYHLLIETPEPDVSPGLQYLNGQYAQKFNLRHGYSGHLFQGRFHSVLVESTWHLLELSRYIVLNPVRAGLCRKPEHWRWSSYRAAAAFVAQPLFLTVDWLLGQFGREPKRAREAYRLFVAEARARGP